MGERKFDNDPEAKSLLNFGITETQELGSKELADFLSDNAATATSKPSEITAIGEEPEEQEPEQDSAKAITEKQKKAKAKNTAEADLLSFLSSEEDEPAKAEAKTEAEAKEDDKSKEDTKAPTGSIFEKLSNDLYDLNIFSKEEDEKPIKTAEDFLSKFQSEKDKQAYQVLEDFLSQFGNEYREAFDAIYVKGVAPKDYFTSYDKLQSIANLDMKDTKNQEKVFTEYFRRQGLAEDKIKAKLEKAIDYGDLEGDAADYHEVLVKKEAEELKNIQVRKQQELQAQAQADQAYGQSLQQVLSKKLTEKEFDGIPLTQKEAEETMDYLYTKKWKLRNGELITDFEKDYLELKDPKNIELRVKAALLMKRKFDLTKIKQTAISKKSESLFSNLAMEENTSRSQFKQMTGKSFF